MKCMALAVAMIAGCMQTGDKPTGTQETPQDVPPHTEAAQGEGAGIKTNVPASYLCVGMETSKRFGSCPGCAIDAKRMTNLLRDEFGYKGETLVSAQATKKAVVSKLKDGISKTPENGLFLFIYSGHGGQEYLGGTEPDGSDKDDEYLCLYDTYMLDDEIWEIVSKCKGRVFMYFDACHSATMYRSVASDMSIRASGEKGEAIALAAEGLVWSTGFTFDPSDMVFAEAMSAGDGQLKLKSIPRILCWSGCKEAEYSYGGSYGGVMTTALSKNWKKGISYDDLWAKVVKGVQKEQPTQHPVSTRVGSGWDYGLEAFR